jgi:hypothetical protein
VFGAVANNICSFGGPPGSTDRTDQLLLNPVVSYHFAKGWSVGSSPNITTNWIASRGKWTVPVGGGFGKAFQLTGRPMKLDLDAYYDAIRPKAGNAHSTRGARRSCRPIRGPHYCCTASAIRRTSSRIWVPASELGDLERIWS